VVYEEVEGMIWFVQVYRVVGSWIRIRYRCKDYIKVVQCE